MFALYHRMSAITRGRRQRTYPTPVLLQTTCATWKIFYKEYLLHTIFVCSCCVFRLKLQDTATCDGVIGERCIQVPKPPIPLRLGTSIVGNSQPYMYMAGLGVKTEWSPNKTYAAKQSMLSPPVLTIPPSQSPGVVSSDGLPYIHPTDSII